MNNNQIWQIVKVDFLDKVRKRSFIFLVFATVLIALSINNQNFVLMYDGYISDFNSASLSSTIAVIFTILFLLVGFYLTKGSIEKDRYLKMGDIIASTPLNKTTYIFGKWLGNVITLQFVVLIIFLFSVFIQLTNQVNEIDLIQIITPFLTISVPAMFIVASFSILFDVISILKNALGSIIYFFVWIFYIGISISSKNSLGDLSGLRSYWESFGNSLKLVYPKVNYATSFLFMSKDKYIPFSWGGILFNKSIVYTHFVIALIVIIFCLFLSIILFDRFTEKFKSPIFNIKVKKTAQIEQTVHISKTTLSSLQAEDIGYNFFAVFRATFKVIFKMIPISLWLIEAVLAVALIIVPSSEVKHILYSTIWLVPIFFWSQIGLFQSKYGMKDLFSSTFYSSTMQLVLILIASVLLTMFLCFGTIMELIIKSDFFGATSIVIGSIFVSSFALCIGLLMKKTKLFELCYLFIWYYGILDNSIPQLDFLSISANSIVNCFPYFYLIYSIVFFGISILFLRLDYSV